MTSGPGSKVRPSTPAGTRHARFSPANARAGSIDHGRHLDTPDDLLEGLAECLHAAGREVLRLNLRIRGIGLHFGAAQTGTIGAERRLDCTVIGPGVNVAARVDALCSKAGRRAWASAAVARHAAVPSVELGAFSHKGGGRPVAVFAVG